MASILAFESFDGGSHKQFRETLTSHSTHQWTWITLPPRSWKWRMAIGAQEMLDIAAEQRCFDNHPDIIFATSLIDAAALRAALPAGCKDIPLVLYMHENQVAYPTSDPRDASFAFTNLQSVLTADLVLFNSQWNLESFISGITELLCRAWDCKLQKIEQRIRDRASVAWVPVDRPPTHMLDSRVLHNAMGGRSEPIRIVWPHRWEHDKNPEALLELARELSESLNLRWIILGEQFAEIPEALETFSEEFADRIDHMGYVESKEEYWQWLHKADWVLSTATHEFFGIAVVEALFAGCLPWLPDRLSYQELLPPNCKGLSPVQPPEHVEGVRIAIAKHLHAVVAQNATRHIDALIAEIEPAFV